MEHIWKVVTGAALSVLGGLLLLDVKATREQGKELAALRTTSAAHDADISSLKNTRIEDAGRLARIETKIEAVMVKLGLEVPRG